MIKKYTIKNMNIDKGALVEGEKIKINCPNCANAIEYNINERLSLKGNYICYCLTCDKSIKIPYKIKEVINDKVSVFYDLMNISEC